MLGSEHVQRQIVELTTGLAVKGINIGELRGVRVPIVEKDLQEEVCRDLSVIHEAVESCRRRLKEARSTHGLLLLVAMSPRS